MLTKLTLKMRTYYMTLNTNELIDYILNDNILIREIAKEEFLKRDLNEIDKNDDILNKVISKLSIENIWELMNTKQENHFIELLTIKLNKILEYYQRKYSEAYLLKLNENEDLSKLIKR